MTETSSTVTDQGGLSGAYVPISPDHANAVLQEHYGFRGRLRRFETEKDDTFRVSCEDGRKFVLKIANPTEPLEEIDFQTCMMRYAATRDPALAIPDTIPTVAGQDYGFVTDEGGHKRVVRVLSYLDGIPLDSTESNPRQRVEIGKVLGRLRLATEGFDHPGAARQYAWDVQHLLTLEHLLAHVDDPSQRQPLEHGFMRFRGIEPGLRQRRQQVLHNDFSKSNIVVDHNRPEFVTGIIDFGDSVKTSIAVDVATALLNQLPQGPYDDLFYRGRDVLRGYLQVTELTEDEIALIPHLVMGRVILRALLTLWRTKMFPENTRYIMRNTYQGWHQLNWFLARSPDQVSDLLMSFADQKGRS
ncbi:Ser/Thr protein kinase RdoA involved in Cpx stress response, MazF antagonist [Ruegeria halocynthiae]|uniref:Hydroxylysine kinase n=1 Tax=Ruegeria halocynthiae TaxID=985054 RepID=A0A1H3EIS3_9RHOB|nr:phosphotransferase [Ruegeria halocynthiae]SDX78601.1 Ser/Thr protein kinase RdoA involved in Cpx stress response, MazF antagonist [Ruegeria halocynthiae]